MRLLPLAIPLLLALAACGETPPPKQAAAEPGQVTLGTTRNMPDWLLVARTADGGYVHFNQRAIVRNADGTADIWVQIRHGRPQLYGEDSAKLETTVRYQLERLHYRFRCASDQFVIVKRQFLSSEDRVDAEQDMPADLWRRVPTTGPARVVQPIACRGR
jgi:hypothetical protein